MNALNHPYLNLAAMEALRHVRLRPRGAAEGTFAGPHKSHYRGTAVEFADYREYTDGDDIRLEKSRIDGYAQKLTLQFDRRRYELHLPLVGEFQVENALVAAGLAIVTGTPPEAVFAAMEDLEGAKGRLEFAGQTRGAPVFIDYAHKPDALSKTLDALRPYVKRRLVVVFGCGGNRDQGKRPIMGEVAARLADVVVVTDDNPRSESPARIRAEVLAGAARVPAAHRADVLESADRREAIRLAVTTAQAGDTVLVAGKGHETGQEVDGAVHPFDDRVVLREEMGAR